MTRRGMAGAAAGMLLLAGCERLRSARPGETSGGRPGDGPRGAADAAGELQLDYSILLDDRGAAKRINEKHHFESGDRFRVEIRPSFDAHVYLLNRGPGQANYSRLFPSPKIPFDNPLASRRTVTLPDAQDWYMLDNKAGVENVVLVAAAFPVEEFNTPERTIPRDECEARIALVERDYRPGSSRRFEDGDWVKLFAAGNPRTVMILRLPLDHR